MPRSIRLLLSASISISAVVASALLVPRPVHSAQIRSTGRQAIATDADFRRAMTELSNWGRWGKDDELGAANLITPGKRKQAMALAKEGRTISLAHDVAQETAADAQSVLRRTIVVVDADHTIDKYEYTGSYHGAMHSHLDAVDCHVMFDGKGYNGRPMEDITSTGGCPKGNINALKDGIVTRGILLDATRLPGKASPQGWLEPGTAIHREDLETLEAIEHVKVAPGDVVLLYTGRWKRRAAVGAWSGAALGWAGYHADTAYFIKERDVSFIAGDGPTDVAPTGLPPSASNPIHRLAITAMGVSIFDNLDFERAIEEARALNRYEFLFMAAPLRVDKGTGSPVNPLAIF